MRSPEMVEIGILGCIEQSSFRLAERLQKKRLKSHDAKGRDCSVLFAEDKIDMRHLLNKIYRRGNGIHTICTERTNDEAMLLREAAFKSHFPPDKMTNEETDIFRDIALSGYEAQKAFIYIRNRLLYLWLEEPRYQLVLSNVISKMDSALVKNNVEMISRVYHYLERFCHINFGVFRKLSVCVSPKKGRVIVIGAGISGLTAARQLDNFGFEVIVLEARNRIGGRIATFRKNNYVADLGAIFLSATTTSPVEVLQKQIGMELVKIKPVCPLYDCTGSLIPKEKDEIIEVEFNKLLESASFLAHELNLHSIKKVPLSLGQTLELIIKLQERKIKVNAVNHMRKHCDTYAKLANLFKKRNEARRVCEVAYQNWLEADTKRKENKLAISIYEVRKRLRELRNAQDACKKIENDINPLTALLSALTNKTVIDMYMSSIDRRILDWHFANLESANAAPLFRLSLRNWNQDDAFDSGDDCMAVRSGFSSLAISMSEGLDIRLNRAVKNVNYTSGLAEVTYNCLDRSEGNKTVNETLTCNAVLVTVPLGVLKENSIKFEPALPAWKLNAIQKLGFGNTNRVILIFEKVFWDANNNFFGHVASSPKSRGEFFMFWSIYKQPVLLALVAGEAADIIERVSDEIVIARCLAILKGIFGANSVPPPKESMVTRWKMDQWSRGAFSYMSRYASAEDYDQLAKSVSASNSSQPSLFFAGEHTNRFYPASVHGAIMSGLREARRIADVLIGPLNSNGI